MLIKVDLCSVTIRDIKVKLKQQTRNIEKTFDRIEKVNILVYILMASVFLLPPKLEEHGILLTGHNSCYGITQSRIFTVLRHLPYVKAEFTDAPRAIIFPNYMVFSRLFFNM